MVLRPPHGAVRRALAGMVAVLVSLCLEACGQAEHPGQASSQTQALFDAALTESFFDFPWPSDLRIDAAGHPIMTGFPNPENLDILEAYMQTMERDVVGFGNNAPLYFRFTGDIDASRLPALPSDSLEPDAPVFIVNIDPRSEDQYARVPIHARYVSEATMYAPSHLLGMAPSWGFPMRPSTTYAAVVLKQLGDAAGQPLAAPPAFSAILRGETVDDPALAGLSDQLAPLLTYLDQTGIPRDDVAIATVFTVQDPVSDMAVIRSYLRETQAEPTLDPSLEKPLWYVPEARDYEKVHSQEERLYPRTPSDVTVTTSKPYLQFEGVYQGPNFQEGEAPYADEGGAIRFDEQGNPIIQRWEPLRFTLAVPKGTPPAGGWPIAIFAHGTGGSYKDLLYSGTYRVAEMLAPRGIAVIGIDEPLHGERAPAGTDPELMSFNFMNPDAARSNFRQAAIDVFYLTWFCRTALKVPASISPTGTEIRFDPDRVSFVGHSHGGLSGSLLTPFEPDLRASVLSGSGGGLCLTILLRKDYVDFEELFRTILMMPDEEPLDEFHSVMAVVQTLVEITDPINYSPLFVSRPLDGIPHNVLMTEGFYDEATPPITCEAEICAGALPLLEPLGRTIYGLELQGIDPVAAPASGNLTGPDGSSVTAAAAQFPDDNHYAVFRDFYAASLYADFLQSISYTDHGVLELEH